MSLSLANVDSKILPHEEGQSWDGGAHIMEVRSIRPANISASTTGDSKGWTDYKLVTQTNSEIR